MSLSSITNTVCQRLSSSALTSSFMIKMMPPLFNKINAIRFASLNPVRCLSTIGTSTKLVKKTHSISQPISTACSTIAKRALSTESEWNLPLTFSHLMTEAIEQFNDSPYREAILKTIMNALENHRGNSILLGPQARVYETKQERECYQAVSEGLDAFFSRRDLFKGVKIIRQGGEVSGYREFTSEVMNRAEEFVANLSMPDSKDIQKDRKRVLNVIRSVAYKHQFYAAPIGRTSNPKAYIEIWKKNNDVITFPKNKVLEFFESIL